VHCSTFTDVDKAQVLKQTKTAYEEIRMDRLGMILQMAKYQVGNLIAKTWKRWVRDWMVWIFCKLDIVVFSYALVFSPPILLGKLPVSINDGMFGYDVAAEVQVYLSKPR
jgi:hypothetical protein